MYRLFPVICRVQSWAGSNVSSFWQSICKNGHKTDIVNRATAQCICLAKIQRSCYRVSCFINTQAERRWNGKTTRWKACTLWWSMISTTAGCSAFHFDDKLLWSTRVSLSRLSPCRRSKSMSPAYVSKEMDNPRWLNSVTTSLRKSNASGLQSRTGTITVDGSAWRTWIGNKSSLVFSRHTW